MASRPDSGRSAIRRTPGATPCAGRRAKAAATAVLGIRGVARRPRQGAHIRDQDGQVRGGVPDG
eukprot:11883175-Heterocapsa_arctica.AAC.1